MLDRSISGQMKIDYDRRNDILYLMFTENDGDSYGDEVADNVYLLRDIDTDEVIGIMIFHPRIHTDVKQKSLQHEGYNIGLDVLNVQ